MKLAYPTFSENNLEDRAETPLPAIYKVSLPERNISVDWDNFIAEITYDEELTIQYTNRNLDIYWDIDDYSIIHPFYYIFVDGVLKKTSSWLDRLALVGDDPRELMMIDREMGGQDCPSEPSY